MRVTTRATLPITWREDAALGAAKAVANPLAVGALSVAVLSGGSYAAMQASAARDHGIPPVAFDACVKASEQRPVAWQDLCSIMRVESGFGSSQGGHLADDGTAVRPDGSPITSSADAKGPCQFIDSTWSGYATDGNGDGRADVNNVYDCTLAAASLLLNNGYADDRVMAFCRFNGGARCESYAESRAYMQLVSESAAALPGGQPTGSGGPPATAPQRAKREPSCGSELCALGDHAVWAAHDGWDGLGRALGSSDRTRRLSALWQVLNTPVAGALDAEPAPPQNDPVIPSSPGVLVCPATELETVGEGWGVPRSWGGTHQGQDLLAAEGSPVVSPVAGTVVDVHDEDDNMLGLWVTVRAGNGDEWLLGHNQANVVEVGDRVTAGQQVASVGQSGNAARDVDGPQVHVGFYPGGGQLADPSAVVAPCEAQLSAAVEP